MLDRYQRRELRHAAVVVGVVVRDDQMIDRSQAVAIERRLDPLGVPAVEAGPAGVDQDRLAGRRDDQSGSAPEDIDPFDRERAIGGLWRGGDARRHDHGERRGQDTATKETEAHAPVSLERR
jgi:hypothetical protein